MADREKVINVLSNYKSHAFGDKEEKVTVEEIIAMLKAQEPVEPHYTKLEYMVNGMPYVVHHPECPRCIENGLILWDAEIERGAAYCKRCGQAVKWE